MFSPEILPVLRLAPPARASIRSPSRNSCKSPAEISEEIFPICAWLQVKCKSKWRSKEEGAAELLSCKPIVEMVWELCGDKPARAVSPGAAAGVSVLRCCPAQPSLLCLSAVPSSPGANLRTVNTDHSCGSTEQGLLHLPVSQMCPQATHLSYL